MWEVIGITDDEGYAAETHVIPLHDDDPREHIINPSCWCGPKIDMQNGIPGVCHRDHLSRSGPKDPETD